MVKLVVEEPESSALRLWLDEEGFEVVSSDLTRAELLRATRRRAPEHMVRARDVLAAIELLQMPTMLFERAAEIADDSLRSLDALHLTSALELGDDLDGIVTYDERQSEAALRLGVQVFAPR